jgi:hypothetical protein
VEETEEDGAQEREWEEEEDGEEEVAEINQREKQCKITGYPCR